MRLRKRTNLRPAVEVATKGRIKGATLHTLRHTHASMLHYCGFTVPEAAQRLGHAPALHLKTYAHVIDAISGQRFPNLDALIAAARADVPPVFRSSGVLASDEVL